MPADHDEFESRMHALERRIADIAHDAASARVLSGAAERDCQTTS
jgi:hypothetical protein